MVLHSRYPGIRNAQREHCSAVGTPHPSFLALSRPEGTGFGPSKSTAANLLELDPDMRTSSLTRRGQTANVDI